MHQLHHVPHTMSLPCTATCNSCTLQDAICSMPQHATRVPCKMRYTTGACSPHVETDTTSLPTLRPTSPLALTNPSHALHQWPPARGLHDPSPLASPPGTPASPPTEDLLQRVCRGSVGGRSLCGPQNRDGASLSHLY